MMISVNVPDHVIHVDGIALQFRFEAPADVIAIQWDSDHLHGQVERKSGAEPFKDPTVVEPYLTAWQNELSRRFHHSAAGHTQAKNAHEAWLEEEKKRQAELDEQRLAMEAEHKRALAALQDVQVSPQDRA